MKTKTFSTRVNVRDLATVVATLEHTFGIRARTRSEVISLSLGILADLFRREGKVPFPIPTDEEALSVLDDYGFTTSVSRMVSSSLTTERIKAPVPTEDEIEKMLERARKVILPEGGQGDVGK